MVVVVVAAEEEDGMILRRPTRTRLRDRPSERRRMGGGPAGLVLLGLLHSATWRGIAGAADKTTTIGPVDAATAAAGLRDRELSLPVPAPPPMRALVSDPPAVVDLFRTPHHISFPQRIIDSMSVLYTASRVVGMASGQWQMAPAVPRYPALPFRINKYSSKQAKSEMVRPQAQSRPAGIEEFPQI